MLLDSNSVILAGSAVLIIQGLAFFYFWWRDRDAPWLLWWAAPFVAGGGALAFFATPHWASDIANIAGGNVVRLLSLWALWQGVRLFEGRRILIWPALLITIGWLAAITVPAIGEQLAVRIVLASLLVASLCGLAASELRAPYARPLPSRRPLLIVFCTFAAVMLVRGLLAAFVPFPVGALPADPLWLAGFTIVVFAHFIFVASLFLAMTRERREAEQRNFALLDPLTGLLNRRAFSDFTERMNRRRAGLRRGIAVLVLDLDHFKAINDRFGHEVGDRLLRVFAERAEASVRPTDELFRMGGEEFCFVLPETSVEEATLVADRIRQAFEVAGVETPAGTAATTVSIGVSGTAYDLPMDALVSAADAAVYRAKGAGRNRVIVADTAALRDAGPTLIFGHRRRA